MPLQSGVAPEQAPQAAPQCCAVLHVSHRLLLHHLPLPQSVLLVHWMQAVPAPLQDCTGVRVEQSVHAAPQCWLVLQGAQRLLLHQLPEPQSALPEHWMHVVPEELQVCTGVRVEQSVHEEPQCWLVLQAVHAPLLHHLPEPHWLLVLHWTHAVPGPLQVCAGLRVVQSVHEVPQCWSVLQAMHVPALQYLLAPQSVLTTQSLQAPFTQPKGQARSLLEYEQLPWLQVPFAPYFLRVLGPAQ